MMETYPKKMKIVSLISKINKLNQMIILTLYLFHLTLQSRKTNLNKENH